MTPYPSTPQERRGGDGEEGGDVCGWSDAGDFSAGATRRAQELARTIVYNWTVRTLSMVHPDSLSDYRDAVHAGEAVPSVFHSLVEAAIRDEVIPERIQTAWLFRQSAGEAVSLAGAVLMLFDSWWVGLGLMVLAVWATIKSTRSINVRLGYCAAIESDLGFWGFRRGYLSLIPLPTDNQERWEHLKAKNDEFLALAELDCHQASSRFATFLCAVLGYLLLPGKLAVGILLILHVWRNPSWISIAIGGLVGAFLVLQSLVRLPAMFGLRRSPRRT